MAPLLLEVRKTHFFICQIFPPPLQQWFTAVISPNKCFYFVHLHVQIPFSSLCLYLQWMQQRKHNPGRRTHWLQTPWVRSLRWWAVSAVYQRWHKPKPRPPAPLHPPEKRWESFKYIAEGTNITCRLLMKISACRQIFSIFSYKHKLPNKKTFLSLADNFWMESQILFLNHVSFLFGFPSLCSGSDICQFMTRKYNNTKIFK